MFVGQVAVFLERLLYILTSVCCAGLVWNQTCADFLTWIFSGEDDSSTQHTQPPNSGTRKRNTSSHKPKYKRKCRNTSKHEHKCTFRFIRILPRLVSCMDFPVGASISSLAMSILVALQRVYTNIFWQQG